MNCLGKELNVTKKREVNFVEIQRKSQNEYGDICIFISINYLKLLSSYEKI